MHGKRLQVAPVEGIVNAVRYTVVDDDGPVEGPALVIVHLGHPTGDAHTRFARTAHHFLVRGSVLVVIDPGLPPSDGRPYDYAEHDDDRPAEPWSTRWLQRLHEAPPPDDPALRRAREIAPLLLACDDWMMAEDDRDHWDDWMPFLVRHGAWSEPRWCIRATFTHPDASRPWSGVLTDAPPDPVLGRWGFEPPLARVFDRRDVLDPLVEQLHQARQGTVSERHDVQQEMAFGVHDLTSLQRAANRRFGTNARRTLAAAQQLYESARLVSYPRTDCGYLPSDFPLHQRLEAIARWSDPEWSEEARAARALLDGGVPAAEALLDSSRVRDHFGIVPTGTEPPALAGDQLRVAHLVAERFLEALGRPLAVWRLRDREVVVELGGEILRFVARASELVERGFREGHRPPPSWNDDPPLAGPVTLVDFEVGPVW